MKYIGDNRLRTILEKKTDKRIVSIERPYFFGDRRALKTANGDMMILVYENQEEMMGHLPTQEEAFNLEEIKNEKLYTLVQKADKARNITYDHYLMFSTNKDWLEEYQYMFDEDLGFICVEIDDFFKMAKSQSGGANNGAGESQKGE